MPVPAKVLGVLVVATTLVVAMVQDVEPEIISVLAVALASLAPAVFSRSGGRQNDRDDHHGG